MNWDGYRYHGQRLPKESRVEIEDANGRRPLPPRNEVRNHSPDGFEWGYEGSGPSQLALAICCDYFERGGAQEPAEEALNIYQEFKHRAIASLGPQWTLEGVQVHSIISEIMGNVR